MEYEDQEWQYVFRFDNSWTPAPTPPPQFPWEIIGYGIIFVVAVTFIASILAKAGQ